MPEDAARPDLELHVPLDPARTEPVWVMHPCRCDAPDPEAARMERLTVPLGPLLEEGRATATCPECEFRVLVVAMPRP
jgi:hypothetical protein